MEQFLQAFIATMIVTIYKILWLLLLLLFSCKIQETIPEKISAKNERITYLKNMRLRVKSTTTSPQLSRRGKIFLVSQLGLSGRRTFVDNQRKIAYIATASGLMAVDVSSETMKYIGSIVMQDGCFDVKGRGNILIATCGKGVSLIDASNPQYLQQVAYYTTQDYTYGIFVTGTLAYIGGGTEGLIILDFSNPSMPAFVGKFDTPGKAIDVSVKGNTAYIADATGGLRILDVSEPISPTEITSFATPLPEYLPEYIAIYIQGNKAYISDIPRPIFQFPGITTTTPPTTPAYLHIVDISQNSSPSLVTSFQVASDVYTLFPSITAKNNYVFYPLFMNKQTNEGGLYIINLTDIQNPITCSVISEPYQEAYGVFIPENSNTLYFVWGKQKYASVDISNPCSPKITDILHAPGDSWGIYIRDDLKLAFLGDGFGGLRILSIADTSSPYEITNYDVKGYVRGISVIDYPVGATLVAVVASSDGLKLIDVTNPYHPKSIGSFNIGESDVWDVSVGDVKGCKCAFLAAGQKGLFIIDINNYANPISVSWIKKRATGVYIQNQKAFITVGGKQGRGGVPGVTGIGRLEIYDISEPSQPLLLSSLELTDPRDVYVKDKYAYVADGNAGLSIIDVSDTSSPRLVLSFNTNGYAWDVWVEGTTAYVALDNGVMVLDVSDPTSPKVIGYIRTPSDAVEIMAVSKNIFTATRYAGLMIFNTTGPKISASPQLLNFGSVNIGEYKDLELEVRNLGDIPIFVNKLDLSDQGFYLISASSTFILEPNSFKKVRVRFSPIAEGQSSGVLSILSDADIRKLDIPLTGIGVKPFLTVFPSAINFGLVPVSSYSSKTFSIGNTGTGILTIYNISISGEAFELINLPSLPFSLGPASSQEISVRFLPILPTTYYGTINIGTNSGSITIPLSGEGSTPIMSVYPQVLSFGSVNYGDSKQLDITIANTGNYELSVTEISIYGKGFSLVNPPQTPFTVNPGTSITLTVRFTPEISGESQGIIVIGTVNGRAVVKLLGMGNFPQIEVAPKTLNFENVKVGEKKTLEIYIKNNGSGLLKINSVNIAGDGFVIDKIGAIEIASSSSTKISVTFIPTDIGLYSAYLTIYTNYGVEEIELIGKGVSSKLIITPSLLDFGRVATGSIKTLSFSISNAGNYPLEVSNIYIEQPGNIWGFANAITLPFSIQESMTKVIDIYFEPTENGIYSGKITIETSGGKGWIIIQGEGISEDENLKNRVVKYTFIPAGGGGCRTFDFSSSQSLSIILTLLWLVVKLKKKNLKRKIYFILATLFFYGFTIPYVLASQIGFQNLNLEIDIRNWIYQQDISLFTFIRSGTIKKKEP